MKPYGTREERGPAAGPLAPDLTRSTTFAARNAEELRAIGAGEVAGEFYPRYGHPAGRRFEADVAALEEAEGAVSFASGMAAIHAVLCGLLRSGETLACSRDVYGGVAGLVREDLRRFGVAVAWFDPFDSADLERALQSRPRLVHVESPTNPLCRVLDLERISAAAHAAGARVSVDATFVPPPFQRPARLGVDLVMHSATKFLGGHSDALGGVVAGPHDLLGPIEKFRRRAGAVLAPDTAWLLHRSLATLELRARAAAENAARLARFLDGARRNGGRVAKVHYPGLPDHPDHAVARRTLENFGSVLAFEAKGGLAGAVEVYDRLRTIARAVSLGGVESVASLPLHTSHAMASPEERRRSGIADGLIRVSAGIERGSDLEADLAQALPA
ncbi:MAG: trans-sulfuration enzyme family protein [Planctomycetota bacterium]